MSTPTTSAGSAPQPPAQPASANPTPGQAGVIQTNTTPVPTHGGGLKPQPQQVSQNAGHGISHTAPAKLPVPTLPTAVVKPDWTKAQEYLKSVRAFYEKYSGQIGCNPHFYLVKVVSPLETALNSLDAIFEYPDGHTKATYESQLYTAIMALEMKESYAKHDAKANAQEKERQEGVLRARQQGQKQVLFS